MGIVSDLQLSSTVPMMGNTRATLPAKQLYWETVAAAKATCPSENGCRRPRSNGNGIGNQRSQQHGTEIAIECKLLASRACREREGVGEREGEIIKQGRCIAKKFTTSVGQLIEPLFGLNSMISKYFIGCSE